MADLDRGAYTPPHEGLAFDPRDSRRRRPLPITLILSIVVLLVLIVALVLLYRAGTGGGGEPGTVGEPVGEVREAPPAEAQPVDPATGLEVYTDDPAASGAPVFTEAPEAPIARPAPAPAPAPAAPTGTTGLPDSAPAAVPPAPVAAPPPPPARPAPAAATPATPPVARPTPSAPPATPAPAPPATPTPASPPPARPAPSVPAGTAGAVSVQIGAFNTREQAQAALARRPGGAGQRIEEIQRDGKTLYRAIATGFRTRAEAEAYCASGCIIR
jgi:hypothetical protein